MSGSTEFGEVAKWGAIIVGLVVAVPLVAILATQAPEALVTLIVFGFIAWMGMQVGVFGDEEADDEDATAEVDPLATLQERYAAGELSESEFERRLDRLLESDQRAEDADRLESAAGEREPDREVEFERE